MWLEQEEEGDSLHTTASAHKMATTEKDKPSIGYTHSGSTEMQAFLAKLKAVAHATGADTLKIYKHARDKSIPHGLSSAQSDTSRIIRAAPRGLCRPRSISPEFDASHRRWIAVRASSR